MADAVHEIEAEHPHILECDGAYARAVQLSRLSWSLGLFLGPILSGFLTEKLGYYEMNCTLGLSEAPVYSLTGLALMIDSRDLYRLRIRRILELEVIRAPTACKCLA